MRLNKIFFCLTLIKLITQIAKTMQKLAIVNIGQSLVIATKVDSSHTQLKDVVNHATSVHRAPDCYPHLLRQQLPAHQVKL